MEFYVEVDKSRANKESFYNSYMRRGLGAFKNAALSKLSISKCDNYDKQLLLYSNIPDINKIVKGKHFTYNLLVYIINNLTYSRSDIGEHIYKVYIPHNNPFGDKLNIDLILRIIEYGNGKIRPYNILNNSFLDFRHTLVSRYNKAFNRR